MSTISQTMVEFDLVGPPSSFNILLGFIPYLGYRLTFFSCIDWIILNICLTHEVSFLHYVSHLPNITTRSREMFGPLRVDFMSFES